ncbi:hypothetical protein PMI02_01432, partial [Novosphingobium sp. AP12]
MVRNPVSDRGDPKVGCNIRLFLGSVAIRLLGHFCVPGTA